MYILGFDIGGTKCAVITASVEGENIEIQEKRVIPTNHNKKPTEIIEELFSVADEILSEKPDKIGISCGGPLNSSTGVIMSPPNLPEWDNIPIVDLCEKHFGVPAKLQNDANACALAEWKFGAGRNSQNMIFLTFGTGLGAGLILNGRLYEGTNGNAGEVGHIRLSDQGPVGYGKIGSAEGFCSGGGIKQLGEKMAEKLKKEGKTPAFDRNGISAKSIADAAEKGDAVAKEIYRVSGEKLGKTLSILIDLFNPEKIVIGSIFARSRNLLWPSAEEIIKKEALSLAAECCEVLPAELGENIGDFGAIATALL